MTSLSYRIIHNNMQSNQARCDVWHMPSVSLMDIHPTDIAPTPAEANGEPRRYLP
jgi:hypothetical protein